MIVPAHNAAETLDETLASVRAQTHLALEIIVVDDGSTDATASIALLHAARDQRLRVISQRNAGVAAARNAALAASSADFIAPLDADDLWQPTKLERQLEAMCLGGPRVGLVYTWTALLDSAGHVTSLGPRNQACGEVADRLWRLNLVGSGSCPLMRRQAVERAGCYDETLQARQAQGCEDWKLYALIAEHYEYAVVPEFLTGYRLRRGSMSTDRLRMYRSFRLVAEEALQRSPLRRSSILEAMADVLFVAYQQSIASGEMAHARWLLRELLTCFPYQAFKAFLFRPLRARWRRWRSPRPPEPWLGHHFLDSKLPQGQTTLR